MEPNAENSCRRDAIKKKLRQNFDGKIVRKDLTKKIKEGANVPVYVLEFLLGQYCSSDDEAIIEKGVQNVKHILADNFVRPDEAQKILSQLRKKGSHTIIDIFPRDYCEKKGLPRAKWNSVVNKTPITYVWGPPGTGKTQTLAKIAWAHIDKGERVLMLSYSNVSVDGAILRVTSLKNDVFPGQLVRYGFPKDKRISEHPYLSSYNLAISNYPDLLKRRTQLQAEKKRLEKNDPKLIQVEKELNEIRRELRAAESQCVRNAKFVATTVSKAIVDKEIRNGAFDVVIFDEASMATIPQIA